MAEPREPWNIRPAKKRASVTASIKGEVETKAKDLIDNVLKPKDPKTVVKLESKIEAAIAEIIVKMGLKKLPLLPSRHTMHLMSKAAVAVYEAAVENCDRGRRSEEPVDG